MTKKGCKGKPLWWKRGPWSLLCTDCGKCVRARKRWNERELIIMLTGSTTGHYYLHLVHDVDLTVERVRKSTKYSGV
jgi:hypothetical protein